MFVDRVEIEVQGGHGGDGFVSFRREKFIPRGGPDGGDGGSGGSVIIVAEMGVNNLSALAHRKQWRAEHGQRGGSANCSGRSSADLIIKVPPGTIIYDKKGDFVLKDLVDENDQAVVARGGRGGKGNLRFKSSTNRSPRQFTPGGDAEKRRLLLELKVIADVGLIGKPNAGKSTLLSRISQAHPEIADYPFTTKFPNLGRVQIDFDRSFIVADIPGLIEGAHLGVGLGHEFLRHIERAGILVHLVEPEPVDGSDPIENYRSIRSELEQYEAELMERPELIVVTKSEFPDAEEVCAELQKTTGQDVLLLSAITGQGLDKLIYKVAELLPDQSSNAW